MFLDDVKVEKRIEVDRAKSRMPLERLASASAGKPGASLEAALRAPGMNIIAEVKRRSPSAGNFATAMTPSELAAAYERAGASAISVLTDNLHFGGSLDDLEEVGRATNLPVLRKDFIVDEYQLYEAKTRGADACLLITTMLDLDEFIRLFELAKALSLDVLVEVHDEADLEKALAVDAPVVGINCRNLRTLEVNLDIFFRLVSLVPKDRLVVAESGISEPDQLRALEEAGFAGALIGSALMRSGDPEYTLAKLASNVEE